MTIIQVYLPTPPLVQSTCLSLLTSAQPLIDGACVYRSVQHKPLIFPGTPNACGSLISSFFLFFSFFCAREWTIAARFVTYVSAEDKTPPRWRVYTWIIHGGAKYVYSLHKIEYEKPFFKLGPGCHVCLGAVFIWWHFFSSFRRNRPLLYRNASFSEGRDNSLCIVLISLPRVGRNLLIKYNTVWQRLSRATTEASKHSRLITPYLLQSWINQ